MDAPDEPFAGGFDVGDGDEVVGCRVERHAREYRTQGWALLACLRKR